MKKRSFLLWLPIALFLYVASSGPALLLFESPAWKVVELIYWPLGQATRFAPVDVVLRPYWFMFLESDANPLYPDLDR